jgi:uncharacterized membrane protein YciS (DUF1049 family)
MYISYSKDGIVFLQKGHSSFLLIQSSKHSEWKRCLQGVNIWFFLEIELLKEKRKLFNFRFNFWKQLGLFMTFWVLGSILFVCSTFLSWIIIEFSFLSVDIDLKKGSRQIIHSLYFKNDVTLYLTHSFSLIST